MYSRLGVFLSIPLAGTLVAVACFTQVVQLLQIYYANLLFPVGGLPKAASLGKKSDGLSESLDGHCVSISS
jgi:hypothetical protein